MANDSKKILLVEDDSSLAKVYEDRLSSEGFEVKHVPNGEDALSTAIEFKPDLILLDVMMPIISGIGIIEILATGDTLKDQNILIFSGASLPDIQVKNLLRKDGINGFLKKPVDLDDLLNAVTICWFYFHKFGSPLIKSDPKFMEKNLIFRYNLECFFRKD